MYFVYTVTEQDGQTKTPCYKVIQYYRLNREGNHWKNCQNNRQGKIIFDLKITCTSSVENKLS